MDSYFQSNFFKATTHRHNSFSTPCNQQAPPLTIITKTNKLFRITKNDFGHHAPPKPKMTCFLIFHNHFTRHYNQASQPRIPSTSTAFYSSVSECAMKSSYTHPIQKRGQSSIKMPHYRVITHSKKTSSILTKTHSNHQHTSCHVAPIHCRIT